MWISRRKFRVSVVAVLLAAGLGLAVSFPAAAGQGQLAVTADAFAWLAELWQEVTGQWRGGAADKTLVAEEVTPPGGGTANSGSGDEGPAIDPNGG